MNSGETKSKFSNPSNPFQCSGTDCIKDATYIDKNTLETDTYPQSDVNYVSSGYNVGWDPMNIDASVYGNGFTENNVEIWYYEEPDYQGLNTDESPANTESPLYIKTDFKSNPLDRLDKYSNFTCRFKADDGRIMYTKGHMVRYPIE